MKRSPTSVISVSKAQAWRESTALATGLVALTAAIGQFVTTNASANPDGGVVVEGDAIIQSTAPGELNISQSGSRAVIEWDGFSIDEGETTRFVQPDADAVTLNRVTGVDLSTIAGKLTANGKIILVNPNGIMFTGTAEVDVGSLIASTSDVDNSDVMDETNNVFAFTSGPLSGSVVNDGDVTVAEGGLAAFLAPYVRNNGTITARLGRVELASGNTFTLDLNGDGLTQLALADDIEFEFDDAQGALEVTSDGLISADGGIVVLSISDASSLIDRTINMDGVIQARTIENQNGKIILGGAEAITTVRGDLDVSGDEVGSTGGEVRLTGQLIALTDTAQVDASGSAGGGRVDIGQREDAADPDNSPTVGVFVGKGATVAADANVSGNGGEILVTAQERVLFYGEASAQAGAEGGDGGSIELVSGNLLGIAQATFDASASVGTAGDLRLEGSNILVAELETLEEGDEGTSEPENFFGSELPILDNGTILSGDTIERTLNAGTSIAIFASDAGGGDILIGADIEYDSDRNGLLKLSANRDVHLAGEIASADEPLHVEVSAGGDLSFESLASLIVDVAEDIQSALIGDGESSFETALPALSIRGAIATSGDVILNAGDEVRGTSGSPGVIDIDASKIEITADSGIRGQTATDDLTLINHQGGDGIDIINVGDATLRLRDGSGTSIDIENTGDLTLAEFEAKDSSVSLQATGDIEALTTIGSDDAPVDKLEARAGRGLKLAGAVSSNDQILIGENITLAGSYITNGGQFRARDSLSFGFGSIVIDGSGGPVVIDTRNNDSSDLSSSGSIGFIGSLDGTNPEADDLSVLINDGEVRFVGDVGGDVPLGVVRVVGSFNEAAVSVSDVTTDEDVAVALSIGEPNDQFDSFTISGLPVDSRLSDGVREVVIDEERLVEPIDLADFDLDTLTYLPPENSDENANISVTLVVPGSDRIRQPDSGVFNVAELINGGRVESDFAVTVNPVIDGAEIETSESDWSGNRLPVEFSATLLDNDGSESVTILVDGLPEGTSLSAGTLNPDGSVSLKLAELNNLELISANAGDQVSALTVSAITTEINDPDQTMLSPFITLAIPDRPAPPDLPPDLPSDLPSDLPPDLPFDLPPGGTADSRIALEGAGQQGPIGDAFRPNRLPDSSPIVTASSRQGSPEILEDPIDPFSVEPAAGEDETSSDIRKACPDIVEASVSWQSTASDAAFNVNPNLVPYSVDVYCGGYQMTAAGRGVYEEYQDLSFVSRDFWTDLKQERTPSLIEELRSD